MALAIGSSSVSVRSGSAATKLRVGKDGAWGVPEGHAILSISQGGGVDTIIHSAADGLGLDVTYAYYKQTGTPPFLSLPVIVTPLTSSTANGITTVTATTPGDADYRYYVAATNSAGSSDSLAVVFPGSPQYPQSWPSDSFPAHLQDQVASLSPDAKTAAYAADVRNESAWFASVDLTSVPTTARGGVLISPEHALFAAHYAPSVGATITWQTAGNEAVSRTVAAIATHPDYDPVTYRNDIAVVKLSSPVTNVSVAKTLPADWRAYVPTVSGITALRVPTLAFEIGTVQEVSSPLLEVVTYSNGFVMNYADRAAALRPSIVSGDSGQPIFFVVNGEAVLAGLWTGSFYGTFLPDEITEVNALMADLGGGHSLQTVGLAEFSELKPGAPTLYTDPEYLAPVDGEMVIYWLTPEYTGTSPITAYAVYADGDLLSNATFTVGSFTDYGNGLWSAVISGSQGDFAGTEIQVAAINAAGYGTKSSIGTVPS